MKYITLADPRPSILMFPGWLTHAEVAAGRQVLGAGFIDTHRIICHGGSVSLGVDARPEDTEILRALWGSDADDISSMPSLLQRQAS